MTPPVASQALWVAFYEDEEDSSPVSVELTWDELVQTVTADRQAPCTTADCKGKKCPHKSRLPDAEEGAWSPVQIEGSRANDNVKAVTVLVLDGDGLTDEQLAAVVERVRALDCFVHTTHRHRPGAPAFVRLVVRLSRPVLPAEWSKFYPGAIAVLGLVGIFDPTCKDLSRLYFLPTHPQDVPFLTDVNPGTPLDVDAVLLAAEPSSGAALPTPPEPEFAVAPDAQGEDYSNFGKLVAMLGSYRQSRARGSDTDRERAALIGRLLNGQPLAAPGGNAETPPIEPPADLPQGRGYAIMRAAGICTGYLPVDVPDDAYLEIFARSIDAMCFGRAVDKPEMIAHLLEKIRIGKDHRREFDAEAQQRNTIAKAYLTAISEERAKARTVAQASTTTAEQPSDDQADAAWMPSLQMRKDGEGLVACGHNAYLILKNAAEVKNNFRWNDVALAIEGVGFFANVEPEVFDVKVSNYLTSKWGLSLQPAAVYRQILAVAYENRYDPIRDYLRSLKWDGAQRIDANGGWLVTYAKAETSEGSIEYVDQIGKKWLIGAVARGLEPGCKMDNVLVVEGKQGKRKSSLFEVLGGKWYADMAIVIGDKDSKMIAGRSWICEIPDLAAVKKTSEINAIKAFFSTRVDTFRPPFGRAVVSSPRRNTFAGTTNEDQYLGDPTGNRRFWCVKAGQIDLAAVIRDKDQIWAEAVVLYDKHVNECQDKLECGCWWFTGDTAKKISKLSDERLHDSPFEAGITEWWTDLAPEKRPPRVTTNEVAKVAMQYTQDRVSHWILTEIGSALGRFGFKHKRAEVNGKFIRLYEATEALLALPQSEKGKNMAKLGGKLQVVK